jgi:hypothetical protein
LALASNYVNSSADRGVTGNDNYGVTYGISLSFYSEFLCELHPDEFGNYPANPFLCINVVVETIALMKNNESVNRFTNRP